MAESPGLQWMLENLKSAEQKLRKINKGFQERRNQVQQAREDEAQDDGIVKGLRDVLLDNPIRSKNRALDCFRRLYHFLN